MSRDQYQWLLSIPGLGLVAVVAVAVLQGKAPTGSKADPPAAEASASNSGAPDKPTSTPEEFLVRTGVFRPGGFWDGNYSVPGQKVEYLIVTLPDPAGSHLGYVFDQGVDAVIRAVTSAGYQFEGHWFPWEVVGESKEKRPTLQGNPDEHPGVLGFRKPGDVNHRLVVLVPGEDPVSGVRPGALNLALDLAATATEAARPVRVVSPMYSGSQASLARVFRSRPHAGPGLAFDVYSGSATGLRPWAAVVAGKEQEKELKDRCGERIKTTSASVTAMRQAVLHYLASDGRVSPDQSLTDRPADPPRYAALVEANTGYGAAAAVLDLKADPDAAEREAYRPRPVVELRFPLHLGRMAGVLAKDHQARDERLGLLPKGRVSLTAQDATRPGRDLLPSGDESRTAALNMERLDQFWAVLRRERVRYVEIVATDARDRIFLTQLLRENCRDVVPFSYGAQLLDGHPDYLPHTRGTMVATTYPLRPTHQERTGAWSNRRESFATNGVQGTYNAILAQLGRPDKMIDYAPPAVTGAASPPPSVPPVWVMVLGEHGDPVPLAYFTNLPPADRDALVDVSRVTTGDARHALRSYQPHRLGLWFLAAAVAVAGVGALRWAAGRPTPTDPAAASLDAFHRGLLASGVAFAAAPLLGYFVTTFRVARDLGLGEAAAAAVLMGVVGMAAWAALGPVRWAAEQLREWGAGRPAAGPPYLAGVWLLTVALGLVVWVGLVAVGVGHVLMLDDAGRWLFAERAADTGSGTSVVLPTLAFGVGIGMYGGIGLYVVRQRDRDRVTCPFGSGSAPTPAAGAEPVPALRSREERFREVLALVRRRGKELDRVLESPGWRVRGSRGNRRWLVVPAAVAVFGVIIGTRAHPTWEAGWWNWLFAAGFAVLAVLTLTAGFRLYYACRGVDRLTAAILRAPMVGAYDRLPDRVARLLARSQLASRSRPRDLPLLLQLRDEAELAVDAATGEQVGPVKQAFADWKTQVRRWADRTRPADADPGSEDEDVNDLCRLARRLTGELVAQWARRRQPLEAAIGWGPQQEPDGDKAYPWVAQVERFVAVMGMVFVAQYLVRMRAMAVKAWVTAAALLFATTVYQFQPEGVFMTGALALAGGVAVLILWVLYETNRNELFSRISRSTPNRFSFDWAFVANFAALVMPLVLVAAVQSAGRTRAVIEPVLGWFR